MTRNATKRLAVSIAVLAAVSLISGCSKGRGGDSGAKTGAETQAIKPIAVNTAVVEGRTVVRTVEATGTLFPWDEVTVGSEIQGTIREIRADLGDSVRAGEVLALFDDREARLKLEDADASHRTNVKTLEKEKARLLDASNNLERLSSLYRDGMASESQHDGAKALFDIARAQYREAQARIESSRARAGLAGKYLSDTVIMAPISGEIKKRFVSAGETVKDKTPLFSIVSAESSRRLKFRGTVPETSVPGLKEGEEAVLTVEAFGERDFKGVLTRLSPEVSQQTRSLDIEITVPNPGGVLRPGFFARALIRTRKDESVPFAPDSAVYNLAGVTKVFVIENGASSERIVKTGGREDSLIEIKGNVKAGDTVATSALSSLFDGAKVTAAPKATK